MNLLNNHRYALITGIVLAVVLSLLIGGTAFNQLGLARWFHIVAGVFWIGLLYYFNVAQTPALADAAADKGGPGGAGDGEDRLVGRHALSVGGMPGELHPRIELPERLIDPRAPAEHRVLARHDAAAHALRRRHERRGHIATAEVLAQRGFDLAGEIGGELGHQRFGLSGR